jgi:tRNA G10  N-methylase Trm11
VTLSVQDYYYFNEIDSKRPGADGKSGMLPLKLALMMVNSGLKKGISTVYDPFCGSGTVLMAAIMSKVRNIIGSDKSQKALDDTEYNIEWAQKNTGNHCEAYVFQHTFSEKNNNELSVSNIPLIVTEPYLGKPLLGAESRDEIVTVFTELETIYKATFKSFSKVIISGGRVVIVFPFHKAFGIYISDEILNEIEELSDMRRVQMYSDYIEYSKRGSLLYGRPQSHLHRELFVFEKK